MTGPARARALADAGYRTVLDLLHHLPFRYEDRSEIATVAGVRDWLAASLAALGAGAAP